MATNDADDTRYSINLIMFDSDVEDDENPQYATLDVETSSTDAGLMDKLEEIVTMSMNELAPDDDEVRVDRYDKSVTVSFSADGPDGLPAFIRTVQKKLRRSLPDVTVKTRDGHGLA